MWLPDIDNRRGPKYLRIVDAIAEDILAGRLADGERLPTHRDLAGQLGLTVGTISRAYAEAERRGLLVGEVGRGSYVRKSSGPAALPFLSDTPGRKVELRVNRPPSWLIADMFAETMREVADSAEFEELITYQPISSRCDHREAGAMLMRRRGFDANPDRILVTSGTQHAITASLLALCESGDPIMTEQLTWPGLRALASLLRYPLKPIAMDLEGMLPDAFEAACRASGSRVLYTVPTLHNPTTAIQSLARRQAIAEVARRHRVTIVEDDVLGLVGLGMPPPLGQFAPERSVVIFGTSKSAAPAARIAFLAAPEDRFARIQAAARASNWMASSLMAEVVTRWIFDGKAERAAQMIGEELTARYAIAVQILAGLKYRAVPQALHIWLTLSDPWRMEDFVAAASEHGLSLPSSDLFVAGRDPAPHAVRISLAGPRERETLASALRTLRQLMEDAPAQALAVV